MRDNDTIKSRVPLCNIVFLPNLESKKLVVKEVTTCYRLRSTGITFFKEGSTPAAIEVPYATTELIPTNC